MSWGPIVELVGEVALLAVMIWLIITVYETVGELFWEGVMPTYLELSERY